MRLPLRSYWQLLRRYIAPDRGLMVVLGVLLFGGVAVRLVAPWFAGRFIDEVRAAVTLPGAELTTGLPLLAAAYFLAGILDQLLLVASGHLGAHLAWRATNRLRQDAMEHSLTLDMDFHQRYGPGVMVERIDGDVRELNNFFTEFSLSLLANLLLVAGVLAVVLVVDLRIGLVFVAFSAGALVVVSRLRGLASPLWSRSREANACLYGDIEERFGGLPDIRANGAVPYVQRTFTGLLRSEFHRTRSAATFGVALVQASGVVMTLGGIAILGVAAALFLAGQIPLGTVVVVSMYSALISRPLARIVNEIDDLQRATASITRVRELLETEPRIQPGPGAELAPGPLAVEFEHVTFDYSAREDGDASPPVLCDVSFRLAPAEVLGIVGGTGAGKSTIVRLLLRLYDPSGGRITIGGADLRQLSAAELRRHIRVVTQEVQLFHATLRDNLTLFDDRVLDAELIALLHEVGLGRWFARQARGLDTVLASGGGGLSAGEAQLVGIVRVFVADPAVVILDEPTSRLDPETESLLGTAIGRLLENRTALIVAHRLRTLRRVDTVMVVERGRIVEHAPEAQAARDPNSRYHRGLRLGSLDALDENTGADLLAGGAT